MTQTKKYTVAHVAEYFCGRGPFSILMGVSRVAVQQWVAKGSFPPDQIPWVEHISQGKFNRQNLPYVGTIDDGVMTKGALEDRAEELIEAADLFTRVSQILLAKRKALIERAA